MKKKGEFFRPTRGKVFLTLGTLLFLPVVFARYLATCADACPTSALEKLAAHFQTSAQFFHAASGAYGLIGGAAIYGLACFFHEHRDKLHPHL